MSEIFDSLERKVAQRLFDQITHEEWDFWRLKAKGHLPHFIATVEVGGTPMTFIDVYHDSLRNAAGMASVLFQIGLPDIDGKSITGIHIASEDGVQCRHLTPSSAQIVEIVGAP